MSDSYYTIARPGEGKLTEKMSRFLSFAFHVKNAEEAKGIVKEYQNLYHDSRHVCWAYRLGPEGKEWQLNDNGEPSGTAGKPILGQLNSVGVTDTLVIVVRYFGGIKLGTPGLIAAYREAARLAIDDAGKKEMYRTSEYVITFPYIAINDVMKIVKSGEVKVLLQKFDNTCEIQFAVRKSIEDRICRCLSDISGTSLKSAD